MSKKISLALSILFALVIAASACTPISGSLQEGDNPGSGAGQADHNPSDESPPRELQQVILPDGHPEFPSDTIWAIVPNSPVAIEAPVPLNIPAGWAGMYAVEQQKQVVRYLYTPDRGRPETIFTITVMTLDDWQAIQDEPHGEALLVYADLVWVYNPALESHYEGDHAAAFSRMVGEAYEMAHGLPAFFSAQLTEEDARLVLESYFAVLQTGDYAEAARIYAGDYELLVAYNPDIPVEDHAALFEAACTVNGFACNLAIGEVMEVAHPTPDAYRFTVVLLGPDGIAFTTGDCCSEGAEIAEITPFEFTVAIVDGRFKVLNLPVYVP